MDNWRLIISEAETGLPGAMNMAVDEAIMKAVAQGRVSPTIRFYSWTPAAITLGYFQKAEKELDLIKCQNAGVDVVRRMTGGRSVFHQHEFTYSLAAPEHCKKIAGSVLNAYLAISGGLVEGLRGLGVSAKLAEGKKQSEISSAACFDAPSWYEMVVEGRKLIGSAQTRRESCILQHGSLPLSLDLDLFFSLLNFANEGIRERVKRNYAQKAADLEQIIGYIPTPQTLHEVFATGFESGLNISLEQGKLTPYEKELAQELHDNKYTRESWNYRKEPYISQEVGHGL